MESKILTTKELRLRLQAARVLERSLPDQVRRAYGEAPIGGENRPDDSPLLAEAREKARTSLVGKGLLTAEEVDALSVDEATSTALQRLREQIAGLQAEQERDRTAAESFGTPPRTLRR